MTPIETQIEGIVDSILEDYRHGRAIDKLTPKCDPDKEIIIDMIGKLLRIVYPGSVREKGYRIYNARHNLSMLIEDVMYNLNKQITVILRGSMSESEAEEKAQQISLEFFGAIPQVRAMCNKVLWLHKGQQIEFGEDVDGICGRYEEFLRTNQISKK